MMKDRYLLYEPIVVQVSIELDQPFELPSDPIAVARVQRRAKRNLSGELRTGDVKVGTVLMGGGGFDLPDQGATKVHAIQLGVAGELTVGKNESGFEFFGVPGVYELVVFAEEDGLRSNPVQITLVSPSAEEQPIAEQFISGGIDTVLSLQSVKFVGRAKNLFQKIYVSAPDSVYGQYARIINALNCVESHRSSQRVDNLECKDRFDELQRALKPFAAGHPLRSRALLRIAQAQLGPDSLKAFEKRIEELLLETEDANLRRAAWEAAESAKSRFPEKQD